MTTVESVTGPVDVDDLGRTLMHEHVFVVHSDMQADYPMPDQDEQERFAVAQLHALREAGFTALVDLTVPGLGRDIKRVHRVAVAARFTIVAATGIYTYNTMPAFFALQLASHGPRYLEDFFVRELTEGIGTSGVRAGVLKCVTDAPGLTPDVETILRNVARAHLRTGAPISTHTNAQLETGLLQQRVFRQEGVDLARVVIGHCGDTTDLDYLRRVLDAGSTIGMDRCGAGHLCSFQDRVKTIAALCELGYAAQLVLSHDANCGTDVTYPNDRTYSHYRHIADDVLPALREQGVAEEQIDIMLRDNPRRIFGAGAGR